MKDLQEPFHSICFTNHRPLYIIDLVPINFSVLDNKISIPIGIYNTINTEKLFNDYITIFPLIFACHTKIKYIEDYPDEIKFKSEYIIPQLLLQWYKEKNLSVDGIRYLSCTAKERFPKENFKKFNYVIPVVATGEVGFCNSLKILFSATPVYSFINDSALTAVSHTLKDIVSALDKEVFEPL